MDYQALYRTYRPQRFSEVVGQQHVTHTLAREVVEGKVAHAYLFAGPRGTGKTTTARLLAKSLNCADRGPDGEPDNTCASCVAITSGSSLDVIELDAASHNKVEDVREIRMNVGNVAAGVNAKRVYILDEAHMLSRAAGNALLKTLEEPPEHVVFVLATTEPYKLLDTIRSRSQRFDFHPVGSDVIGEHLARIASSESIDVDEPALAMIASHADGSVRDAMSLLEQVAALGDGSVRTHVVTRALGLADRDAFARLADAMVANDAPAALVLVAELASRGADLRRFVAETVEFFRGVFLAQYAPNLEAVVDESADTLDEWRRHAALIPSAEVLRAVDLLGAALLELRQGREERLVVELTVLKLTRPETSLDPASLSSRLDRLESRLRDLARRSTASADEAEHRPEPARREAPVAAPPPPAAAAPAADRPFAAGSSNGAPARTGNGPSAASPGSSSPVDAPGVPATSPPPQLATDQPAADEPAMEPAAKAPTAPASAAVPSAASVDLGAFQTAWPAIVARVRDAAGPVRHALVKVAAPVAVIDGKAHLEIPTHMSFHLERLQADTDLQRLMSEIAEDLLGARVGIEWIGGDAVDPVDEAPVHERAPDKDRMVDEGDGSIDPADIVADLLGGEIVSE